MELPLGLTQGAVPALFSLGQAEVPAQRASNQIGFHRAIPPEALPRGSWFQTTTGGRYWLLALRSPGASHVRLHLASFAAGEGRLFVYAPGDGNGATVHGPYSGGSHTGSGEFWAGSVEGDTVVVAFEPEGGGESLPFVMDRLSHGSRDWAADAGESPREKPGRERALAGCHMDAMCNPGYNGSMDAVARLRIESGGETYLCTGWLINTRANSLIPYLMTANHCVPDQAAANTLETVFRYRTAACGGAAPEVPARSTLGATYLTGRPAAELDFSLLRLPSTPAGAVFLGWDAGKLPSNTSLTTLGYPEGSFLRTASARIGTDHGPKFSFFLTAGLTEGGSGGAPWMSAPNVVRGLHARGTASNFADACRAQQNGEVVGGATWFSEIYPLIASYLEDAGTSCTFSLNGTGASFPPSGGTGSIGVTASRANCAWAAASSDGAAVAVVTGAAGSGAGSVTYTVAPHAGPAARSTVLTVAGRTFTVAQAGVAPVCTPVPLAIGAMVGGTLNSAACASPLRPGAYARRFQFSGAAGQTIAVELSAVRFDPYLYLIGPNGAVLTEDDDGGVDTNARIPRDRGTFRLPATGTYVIEATSFLRNGANGPFSIAVRSAGPCTVTAVAIPSTTSGALATADCFSPLGRNFYADRFTFTGNAGQQVRITVESPILDTYLTLLAPDGTVHAEDDDSAGNLNSRVPRSGFLALPRAGTYTIEVSTFNELATGGYVLRIETGADGVPPATPPPGNPAPTSGAKFRAVTPCRLVDSRAGGGTGGAFGTPIFFGGTARQIPIPQSPCGIPSTARAYSLNLTVVPGGPLSYLTIWATGSQQPPVSTLNSFDGRVVANAAIVPAGTNGAVSVFVTDNTHVLIDINGYYE